MNCIIHIGIHLILYFTENEQFIYYNNLFKQFSISILFIIGKINEIFYLLTYIKLITFITHTSHKKGI